MAMYVYNSSPASLLPNIYGDHHKWRAHNNISVDRQIATYAVTSPDEMERWLLVVICPDLSTVIRCPFMVSCLFLVSFLLTAHFALFFADLVCRVIIKSVGKMSEAVIQAYLPHFYTHINIVFLWFLISGKMSNRVLADCNYIPHFTTCYDDYFSKWYFSINRRQFYSFVIQAFLFLRPNTCVWVIFTNSLHQTYTKVPQYPSLTLYLLSRNKKSA